MKNNKNTAKKQATGWWPVIIIIGLLITGHIVSVYTSTPQPTAWEQFRLYMELAIPVAISAVALYSSLYIGSKQINQTSEHINTLMEPRNVYWRSSIAIRSDGDDREVRLWLTNVGTTDAHGIEVSIFSGKPPTEHKARYEKIEVKEIKAGKEYLAKNEETEKTGIYFKNLSEWLQESNQTEPIDLTLVIAWRSPKGNLGKVVYRQVEIEIPEKQKPNYVSPELIFFKE